MSYKDFFYKEAIPKLKKELDIKNDLAVARPTKVVVNVGVGEAVTNKKVMEKVMEDIAIITGQKPVITKARKSISGFKIRKGMPIGVKATLRSGRMFDFLEKLTRIVLPRIRDFHGIPEKSIDLKGNLNIGFTEQTLFPEIEYDKVDKARGLEVTVVTTAKDKETGKKLFELMGIVFAKKANS